MSETSSELFRASTIQLFFYLNRSVVPGQGEMEVLTIDEMVSMVDPSGKVRSPAFSISVDLKLSGPTSSLGHLLEMLSPRSEP